MIHDVTGREVRRLVDGERDAGETRVTWDGRDGTGRLVPAGVFLVRLDAGDRVERTTVVRLR